MHKSLFTIGHSNHAIDVFIEMLQTNNIGVVVDVRSSPSSHISPQFCQKPLWDELYAARIRYLPMGEELGARRTETECYKGGKAIYSQIRQLPKFQDGLRRLNDGLKTFRIALLCAEKDPVTCHRMILICREFRDQNVQIKHILPGGAIESQHDAEIRLLKRTGLFENELFDSKSVQIERAYDLQAERIAYSGPVPNLKSGSKSNG